MRTQLQYQYILDLISAHKCTQLFDDKHRKLYFFAKTASAVQFQGFVNNLDHENKPAAS